MNKILLREIKKIETPRFRLGIGGQKEHNDIVSSLINDNNEVLVTYYKDRVVISRVRK